MEDMSFWLDACAAGLLIVSGPLNETYRVCVDGEALFVRRRTVFDAEYGQSFAGERQVPEEVARRARLPRLRHVVCDEEGREALAVFDWIDGRALRRGELPDALIDLLAEIHALSAPGFGPVGDHQATPDARPFVRLLIAAEAERLKGTGLEADSRHVAEAAADDLGCLAGEAPCLCHGDVHRRNVLLTPNGDVVLVDWEAVRYRVAAADFNQATVNWLSSAQDTAAVAAYADRCGRDRSTFAAQVALLRLLWHLRTYNFQVLVRREPRDAHSHHLRAALEQWSAVQRAT
jgi:aminoglycoside phosphotransferase (APT) family kinase protein